MKLKQKQLPDSLCPVQGVEVSRADLDALMACAEQEPDGPWWVQIDEAPTSAVRHVGVSDSGRGIDSVRSS